MRSTLAVACLVACSVDRGAALAPRVAVGGDSPLVAMFERAGAEHGVDADTLAAASWTRTRFRFASGTDVGLAGIPDRDVARAAALAGVSEAAVRTDPLASLRAGAALLASDGTTDPIARSGFAGPRSNTECCGEAIDAALARGIDGRDADGHTIVVAARPPHGDGLGTIAQGLDYAGATWTPASASNYTVASRGVGDIDHIVIHDTEGHFDGTISWFQDPTAQVSAHYVLRSSDGYGVQMVDEKNVAWHDKCFNTNTVGIEHEGYQAQPDLWYTEAMYAQSAKLTAYLADKYGIAKQHGPILGHGEAPDCSDHTDPGPGWNWDHYIELVQSGGASQFLAGDLAIDAPMSLPSGALATVTVSLANHGTATWDLDATRVGTQDPADRDSELFVAGDWIAPNRATGVDAPTPPNTTGTFTFQIVGPDVAQPTVYDEAFQLVAGETTWFGPTFHVVVQVTPTDPMQPPNGGGCNAGGAGGGGIALALLGLVRRRRW